MRRRLTVRGLMVLVVFAGVGLAAFRVHPALGAFVSSTLLLALIRTSRRIDHLRATGSAIGPLGVVRSFLASMVVATAILEAALIPGLCLVPMTAAPCGPFPTLVGFVISALIAIPVATFARRRLW